MLLAEDNSLYVNLGHKMVSLDVKNGKMNWSYSNDYGIGPTMMIYKNLIFISHSRSGAITTEECLAIDKFTGKLRWDSEGNHSDPLQLDGSKGYFLDLWPHSDNTEYGVKLDVVDLSTGKILESKFYAPVPEGVDPNTYDVNYEIIAGDKLYYQTRENDVYAYLLDQDGSQKPVLHLDGSLLGKKIAGPYAGKLFFKGYDGIGVVAVKVEDPNHTRIDYPLTNPVNQLNLINSGLYVAQSDGEIYALDVNTGKAMFRYQTSARNFGPFQVSGNTLLVHAEDRLYALDVPAVLLKKLTK